MSGMYVKLILREICFLKIRISIAVRGGPFLRTDFPICIRCKLEWVGGLYVFPSRITYQSALPYRQNGCKNVETCLAHHNILWFNYWAALAGCIEMLIAVSGRGGLNVFLGIPKEGQAQTSHLKWNGFYSVHISPWLLPEITFSRSESLHWPVQYLASSVARWLKVILQHSRNESLLAS